MTLPLMAVAMGVTVIEKHLTLGRARRAPSEAEAGMSDHMRRSLAALRDIPAGTPIEADWLTWPRPARGLGPEMRDQVVGRRLKRRVEAGRLIRAEDLET